MSELIQEKKRRFIFYYKRCKISAKWRKTDKICIGRIVRVRFYQGNRAVIKGAKVEKKKKTNLDNMSQVQY